MATTTTSTITLAELASRKRRNEKFFLPGKEAFAFDFGVSEDSSSATGLGGEATVAVPGVAALGPDELPVAEGLGLGLQVHVMPSAAPPQEEAPAVDGEIPLVPIVGETEDDRLLQRELLKKKVPTMEEAAGAFDSCLDVAAQFLNVPRNQLYKCRQAHQRAVERYSQSQVQEYNRKRKKRQSKRNRKDSDSD